MCHLICLAPSPSQFSGNCASRDTFSLSRADNVIFAIDVICVMASKIWADIEANDGELTVKEPEGVDGSLPKWGSVRQNSLVLSCWRGRSRHTNSESE